MSAANNGGPAFPMVELNHISGNPCDQHFGATLRDYFAAKALAALIGSDKDYENRGAKAVPILARFAYEYADAMLVERAK